ncbi:MULTISPECIES: DUF1826 domain-containing protein [Pseudomonas]|jgi:hypothetical protein|uniref:DUF1826 domain-containing protein n=1 Tax=Pseudomonas qingdaonensis TaxID=2056231 RepID=A0ABX8DRL3_9PSED|nr:MULTISPECIES: DUF1826 domain-containing protein [Pseudomonas]MDN5675581.1 DUF1826 domain-containing protein [Pseudomonas sp.]KIU51855.1 hypothetical protein QV12_10515 [Pseudomonas putida]KTC17658.1 hypothetical protein AO392_09710 [Pseudomonas putida]MCO7505081.1 DUF1826 domain-containing protein [Pseudomonas sp. VE 267-6A]MCO7529861.1 DUF1826 domain-containing protein [Pseudomonas sp. 2]
MLALKRRGSARQTVGESPQVLTEVLQDGVNLAVWQRQLPVHVADFAQVLLSLGQPLAESLTLELQPDDDAPALRGLAAAYADLQGYEGFICDVRWLVGAYACLLDARRVGLRLRALEGAMCPRFHVDHVPARLICTYAGPGSEWLTAPDAVQVEQLSTGDVAVLKGERWLGNEGQGLVHRSPAVPAGQRRLMLTLDWMA